MKNSVKAFHKDGKYFKYLLQISSKISAVKLIKEIFICPQIQKLLFNKEFHSRLHHKELAAWKSFKDVVHGFLAIKNLKIVIC